MNATAVRIEDKAAVSHEEWVALAATEYDRFVALLDDLSEEDWQRTTVCTGWPVRDVVGHVLGMMQRAADPAEGKRQDAAAAARAEQGENWLDALTDIQVRSNAELSTAEVLEACREIGPAAAAGRTSTTEEQRSIPFHTSLPGEADWTLGYLLDCILTRDAWMHRLDIARAAGRAMKLTPEHDGVIVADVVAEWARRHAQPFELELTGDAGGTFISGENGHQLSYDAAEFCWILSGRASASGLMSTFVPF